MQQLVTQQALSLKEEYGHLEKDMSVDIFDHPQRTPTVMTAESQTKLLTLLSTLPHGVVKWSHAVPGESLLIALQKHFHDMCRTVLFSLHCCYLACS